MSLPDDFLSGDHLVKDHLYSYQGLQGLLYVSENGVKMISYCQNPNHNSTQPQPNITLGWVRLKNDFAYHPTTTTTTPHKLNVSNISAVTDPILMKL